MSPAVEPAVDSDLTVVEKTSSAENLGTPAAGKDLSAGVAEKCLWAHCCWDKYYSSRATGSRHIGLYLGPVASRSLSSHLSKSGMSRVSLRCRCCCSFPTAPR